MEKHYLCRRKRNYKRMDKQPRLMDLSRMKNLFAPHLAEIRENIYFSNELGILHGDPRIFNLIIQQTPPFIINDHRFGVITRGMGEINFNLQDRQLSAGTLVYLGPGTIITPIRFLTTLKYMALPSLPIFPCHFLMDRCLRHLMVKCATFNYLLLMPISRQPSTYSTLSGNWFINPIIIGLQPLRSLLL